VCSEAGVDPKLFVDKLTDEQKLALINTMKDFRLKITDYRPFEEAIVTAGGVDCSQVNPRTLESKLEKGIYFAGEVLDIDADTGGYNLQIAFSTGYVAGLLK
jgi:predicted flavoprotein YhiN